MKTVIEIATEAGNDDLFDSMQIDFLKRFAEIVRADEREACAKVCDVLAMHPEYASEVTKLAAMAIRARGQK